MIDLKKPRSLNLKLVKLLVGVGLIAVLYFGTFIAGHKLGDFIFNQANYNDFR